MKYVKESRTFTTDEFSAQELITEINDCIGILKANLASGDNAHALDRAIEIEDILLPILSKKIDKMLPFVPADIQEAEKL